MSNETLDFALVAAQIAGGTASHGGTDSFNANNVRIYRDNSSSGTIGSWDAGDTLITGYDDELVVDTAIRLFVVADIPAGLANNRSEERRVGKACVSPCRSRWSPTHENKNRNEQHTKRQHRMNSIDTKKTNK